MSSNDNGIDVDVEEINVKQVNQHGKKTGCITLSGIYQLCTGRPYKFVIGRSVIIGIVEEINVMFLKAKVMTDKGEVLIDLRKASVISEISG